ncbi:biotin/lipoyl-containing protein [Proteiniclasticum sp.]|uniref:biotin/lipoyl-containing protein n=1 Tax=Proteiniclasticum sp. TaxID=2053595 RepID=UPI00289C5714|nr:biotin/lipoyl-containing protein [Proteiniclasticum sp.]
MKTYKITVNGKVYMVEVEEAGANETAAAPVQQVAPAAPSAGNDEKIEAPIQGTILSVKAQVGTVVKRGQILAILEAMKLENEIVSPFDGTVTSVLIKEGQVVDNGTLLMSIRTK